MAEDLDSGKQGLLAFSVAARLEAMHTILEHDVTAIVGPKGK